MTGGRVDEPLPAPTPPEERPPVCLLFTCTANRVRSPLAAELARRHTRRLGLPTEVRSAGRLESGLPAVDHMVRAALELGVDLAAHRSRTVDPELLEWADLTVAMTGEQVLDLVARSGPARGRVLTLREWAAAGRSGDRPSEWSPRAVREWVAPLTGRTLDALLSGSLDVEDPMGRPRRHFRRTAAEIEALVAECFTPFDRG